MLKLAIVLILLVSMTTVAFGLRYLLAKEYMPYHAQETRSSWAEIPTKLQVLILGLLKAAAAGLLALGMALGWLTLPLSRGETWATWAILSLALVNGIVNTYVPFVLRKFEPTAKTPVAAAVTSAVLVMIALGLANLA